VVDKSKPKIQMLEDENTFQEQWTEKWCFVENKSSIMCMIYKKNVSILKEYNFR